MNEDDEIFQQTPDQIIGFQENRIPWWLKATYVFLPIWGLIAMYLYWNGAREDGLEHGHWRGLQEAARTRPN